MSWVWEPVPHGHKVKVVRVPVITPSLPLPPAKDEISIKAGKPKIPVVAPSSEPKEGIKVIEWDHMNLKLFYPMALTSTWLVRTGLYPMAVLRARLQLQKQNTVYKGTWDAFQSIARLEGIRGLYRGFWVTVPQIGTSFIYSTVYEKLRAILQHDYGIDSVGMISSLAGGAAAFSSQIIFVPTDIIAQYMMVYTYADKFIAGNDKKVIEHLRSEVSTQSRSTLGIRVVRSIYHVDGVRGFYRGFWASSAVYTPSCLVFWPSYYWWQEKIEQLTSIFGKTESSPTRFSLLMNQAVSAGLAGVCSTVATNPMEMFRIRIQVHRTSYSETFSRMIRNEGWSIFTKGLSPRLISNSLYSCIVMIGYEMCKRFCVLPEYKDSVVW